MTNPTTYSEKMQRREAWLERRAAKRREWAEKAEARSEIAYHKAHGALAGIAPGQPILVGHHSQRKHENAIRRHDRNMSQSVEESHLAEHHERTTAGCERALTNRHRPDFCVRRIKEAESTVRHLFGGIRFARTSSPLRRILAIVLLIFYHSPGWAVGF